MLTFFIYLLTAVLVIDCVFLVLLVLVQLPKKEAGMGQAFGGAATDALFGAGSGNVLTRMTKWGAGEGPSLRRRLQQRRRQRPLRRIIFSI
jgi:preprotein translocase subunit SecG